MSRSAVPSRFEIARAVEARLHEALLALHAATETEALWTAVRDLVRAALPCVRVTLFLGHLGMREARLVFTDPPIADVEAWYRERARGNPFSPWIEAHRGAKFYRFSDVLPAGWKRGEWHRRFAVPEGWDKGVSILFWSRDDVKAMCSVYRAPEADDFTDFEIGVLLYLYPFVATAIDRVRTLHGERLARQALEEFNRDMPVGVLLLDWELRPEFANREALRAAAEWNFGPQGPRTFNARECFRVPAAIAEACRALQAELVARGDGGAALVPGPRPLAHPALPGRRAMVSVLDRSADPVAPPRFLVIFENGSPDPEARTSGQFQRLRVLTPREREIALLVCEGLSNQEIARQLNKSVLTIKTQLNSVYRKLEVRSRARLIAALR